MPSDDSVVACLPVRRADGDRVKHPPRTPGTRRSHPTLSYGGLIAVSRDL